MQALSNLVGITSRQQVESFEERISLRISSQLAGENSQSIGGLVEGETSEQLEQSTTGVLAFNLVILLSK